MGGNRDCGNLNYTPQVQYLFLFVMAEDKLVRIFFISKFRRVLDVVCFLLGNSPASEFYIPPFRNTVC
jgi:hypothetical protein